MSDKKGNILLNIGAIPLALIYVKGGSFQMGSIKCEFEMPMHNVMLDDFFIGKFQVTGELWEEMMGNMSEKPLEKNIPVENINWYEAIEFCNQLSLKAGLLPYYIIDKKSIDTNNRTIEDNLKYTIGINSESNGFRLPTEAEWEYAACGGNLSCGYEYAGSNNVDDVAVYLSDFDNTIKPVGTKKPNELGIYDMSGNVWEWCFDWYGDYETDDEINPQGSAFGWGRVYRGGAWSAGSNYCRVKDRDGKTPSDRDDSIGIRVVINSIDV